MPDPPRCSVLPLQPLTFKLSGAGGERDGTDSARQASETTPTTRRGTTKPYALQKYFVEEVSLAGLPR